TVTSCTVVITSTSDDNSVSTLTDSIAITDANDQAPTFTGVDLTPSSAEMASGAFETYTIVDTDSSGSYGCTLGGADSGDITCSISGTTVSLTYSATTNYESPADADTDNNYEFTVVIDDDVNDAATQTFTASVTDVGLAIAAGSASLDEDASNSDAVMTASITEGTPTTVSIISGNTDGDSDGNLPFAIATSGAITVNDADDIDYETTTSYTLTVVAYTSSDTVSAAMTITIDDINDQTPTYTAGTTTFSVAEGSTAAIDSFAITDTDTVGTLACAESGNDADDFACAISSGTLTVSWSATPDYESATDSDTNNIYTYTITVSDGLNSATATTYTVTVTDAEESNSVWAGTIAGTLTEDVTCSACSGALTISDADGDDSPTIPDVASTAGANNYGTFVMVSGTWTYTPGANVQGLNANEVVTDTYTFSASDSTTQVVTMTITGANDVSVWAGTTTGAFTEDVA
ncbi:uncharacterized protein METZ01_LOCUS242079, partial [marine metagenome]